MIEVINMSNFGFTLLKARRIDYDANDRSIADFIHDNEPSFRWCFECGCCSATCTSGNYIRFSLRELQILLKLCENEEVKEKIINCMLCGKCILVCPRGVNTRNVIALAQEAFKNKKQHAV